MLAKADLSAAEIRPASASGQGDCFAALEIPPISFVGGHLAFDLVQAIEGLRTASHDLLHGVFRQAF